jgi:hypothetical protein
MKVVGSSGPVLIGEMLAVLEGLLLRLQVSGTLAPVVFVTEI